VQCTHTPPDSFHPGEPLTLSLQVAGTPASARLYYRHVDQAERWVSVAMKADQGSYGASIPGEYTQSVYPLQYYFALEYTSEPTSLYPGFNTTLSNQPYYAIAKRSA
jgi:hypothetical protein